MEIPYCRIPIPLAYAALTYILASFYYLYNKENYGRPFNDALQEYPDLVEIKKKSANKRYNLFITGIICASVLLYLTQPFKKCKIA